jgi:hypothetical protein
MNEHITLSITISVVGTLLGFGLLFLVSWRKAADRHEFNLLRMVGLLCGCLLVPMPLIVEAWLMRSANGNLSLILGALAVFVGGYSPRIVLYTIKMIRGDAKQFLK